MADITKVIPIGHEYGKSLGELVAITGLDARVIRHQIANGENLVINLQDGKGYFRPDENEGYLVNQWIQMMNSRAKEIMKRVEKAKGRDGNE